MDFLENLCLAQEIIDNKTSDSFVLKEGEGRILFSAPHAVEQRRNGKIKSAEPATGLLCEMLHNELNCPIIRKVSNLSDDANFNPVSDFRQALEHYVRENNIKLVIDLHQLAAHRSVMVCIGTGQYRNLSDKEILNQILFAFSRERLGSIQIDKPFAGRYRYTVASSVHNNCGIQSVQIEMNSRLFIPDFREYDIEGVYKALKTCYYSIHNYFGECR